MNTVSLGKYDGLLALGDVKGAIWKAADDYRFAKRLARGTVAGIVRRQQEGLDVSHLWLRLRRDKL